MWQEDNWVLDSLFQESPGLLYTIRNGERIGHVFSSCVYSSILLPTRRLFMVWRPYLLALLNCGTSWLPFWECLAIGSGWLAELVSKPSSWLVCSPCFLHQPVKWGKREVFKEDKGLIDHNLKTNVHQNFFYLIATCGGSSWNLLT